MGMADRIVVMYEGDVTGIVKEIAQSGIDYEICNKYVKTMFLRFLRIKQIKEYIMKSKKSTIQEKLSQINMDDFVLMVIS